MHLDIITPEKILFSAEAEMVVVPGTEGDFGVLPGHASFISTIRPGVITIDTVGSGQRKVAIVGGIAEVVPERCTILAETAEECTSLSNVDAVIRRDAAKTTLDNATNDDARRDAEKKLALAEAVVLATAA